MNSSILGPVVALILWSFVMQGWLYAVRIPAIRKARLKLDPRRPPGSLAAALPPDVQWKADNYNHLMEQPTLFYALALTLALLGAGAGLNLMLAWSYVGLRVVHSLVQVTVNIILVRFLIFTLSSVMLLMLALRAAVLVFLS